MVRDPQLGADAWVSKRLFVVGRLTFALGSQLSSALTPAEPNVGHNGNSFDRLTDPSSSCYRQAVPTPRSMIPWLLLQQ